MVAHSSNRWQIVRFIQATPSLSMKTTTAPQLRERLAGAPHPLLLHVLPEEHFAARRIAGAVNACTYETAFLDKVRELAPAPAAPIIVYGEGAPSMDSADAAHKLALAGYTDVTDFRGGLREWEAAGLPLEAQAPLPAPPVLDGHFHLDTSASVIRWTGQNSFNHHEGTLRLAEGSLQLQHGRLTRGEFVIDMHSIVCTDLADPTWNAMLIGHLQSADFFQVAEYPAARVVIDAATPIADATDGVPNYQIVGRLTLRGVTRELAFPAVIAAADAGHVTAQAHVALDRTQFGSCYGSGRFFAFLGKHVVNDHIHLHLKIQAVRS